jgi:tetrahydromethanopterin S-methyltransferase subunit H
MKMSFYQYEDIKVGKGHFELPPVMIGTIFYDGETIVDRDDPLQFKEQKAIKRIEKHKELADKYNIPEMIEITASTPEAMRLYLEFYLDHYKPPFVLGGNFEARKAGVEFLQEKGIPPTDYVYNAISNLKNQEEVDLIESYNIDTVVILMLSSKNMTSTQRYGYLTKKNQPGNVSLVEGIRDLGVEKIWVDGGVMNLESLAHIIETQQLISESLELPVGTAPGLFLFKYSSPRLNKKYHTRYRRASIISMTSWFSNFIFYGAIEDATESFSSVYQTYELKEIMNEKNISFLD